MHTSKIQRSRSERHLKQSQARYQPYPRHDPRHKSTRIPWGSPGSVFKLTSKRILIIAPTQPRAALNPVPAVKRHLRNHASNVIEHETHVTMTHMLSKSTSGPVFRCNRGIPCKLSTFPSNLNNTTATNSGNAGQHDLASFRSVAFAKYATSTRSHIQAYSLPMSREFIYKKIINNEKTPHSPQKIETSTKFWKKCFCNIFKHT